MILVTGATGNAGSAVARALAGAGQPVRGLVRAGSEDALPAGVEPAVGDLNDAGSVAPGLHGVSGVFMLCGYAGLEQTLADARGAGVERVVLLSNASAPSGDTSNAITRYHIESEAAVRESGLDWSFLQPRTFMTNTLQWAPQVRLGDVVRAPFGGVRLATLHPDDLGAVAAAALTGEGHAGKAYPLTGPESLSPGERVAILAEVLGRDLRFQAQSDEEARAEMSRSMPPQYVDAFMAFFAEGKLDESEVLPTVEEVTGRPPRSYREWATEHADAFR
jgi:uncharacterized protein YbjT (DUF2867 family)